jgi:hypothetical protein
VCEESSSRRDFHKAFSSQATAFIWEKVGKMKKLVYAVAAVMFVALMLLSTASATLDISVTIQSPALNPGQIQTITANTNEPGNGIVFVVEPIDGQQPWTNFLDSHYDLKTWWLYVVPDSMKTEITAETGGKIVSYKTVGSMNGHSITLTFPTDFTGINGVPSTAPPGKYVVLFVYKSTPSDCELAEIDFACGQWLTIPQVPLGTVMALLSSLCAIPAFKLYRRKYPA